MAIETKTKDLIRYCRNIVKIHENSQQKEPDVYLNEKRKKPFLYGIMKKELIILMEKWRKLAARHNERVCHYENVVKDVAMTNFHRAASRVCMNCADDLEKIIKGL